MVRPHGSSWWKVDFHAHSPASFDHGALEGHRAEAKCSYRDWLLAYMAAGVDVVVMTDHNTSEGIVEARDALRALRSEGLETFRELVLIAGVELTVSGGFHLLAVFDQDTPPSSIDRLLERCNFRGDRGDSNATTESSFVHAVKEIGADGGLAIPAHVETRGFLSLDPRDKDLVRDASVIIAAEATTADGAKKVHGQGWAAVLGSDAHHLDASSAPDAIAAKYPGSHFTWVKMESPSLLGLRLALVDPESCVRTSLETPNDPNSIKHNTVRRVTVSRGDSEFDQEFSPWMNAVIGGRGVGKSTIVELIRLAMERYDELPERLETDQSWFSPLPARGDESRYWDVDTVVTVEYTKLAQLFRVVWSGRLRNSVIYRFADGEWVIESGSPQDRFPVLMYSQKQIYETAQHPQSLLRMIDQQPDIDFAGWLQQADAMNAEYRTHRAEMKQNLGVINTEDRVRGELADAVVELSTLGDLLNSPDLAELNALLEKQGREEATAAAGVTLEYALAQSLALHIDDRLESQQAGDVEAERYAVEEVESPWDVRRRAIENAVAQVESALSNLTESREAFEALDPAASPRMKRIAELRALLGKNDSETGEDPAVRHQELTSRKLQLERSVADIQVAKTELETHTQQAAKLLEQIRDHRKNLTKRRRDYLQVVSTPDLKLDLFEQGDEESLETELRRLLNKPTAFDAAFTKESGLRASLPNAKDPKYPAEIDKLKVALKDLSRTGTASQWISWIGPIEGRFYAHLTTLDPDALETEVDLWFPEDQLRLRYSPTEGGQLQSLAQASPGQKTAALLAVILQLSSDPLILDQPEDDLDNKLISDLVVHALRATKSQRQVIVVTHNANVVVNGDAELVVVMEHNVPVPIAELSGSIQEVSVKDAICLVLEGGKTAFESRYRRLFDGGASTLSP